ncbi:MULTISPECIES: zinc ribbon-containing protein [Aeromonas]|uniref:Zinc ribbon-containing protein n=1 Tax=Aeromonas sanarellii TaxID=633415 RepID=A0ABS4B416_9GAMM|nr:MULTISPECIES: zinc ribbon-containing protein [Aeromonas]MBP0602220.1 zinc ribbon-containing protein [Aeromonas sanarellii]MEB6605624.1 zinc ribbon-containing protein [Aeromonas sanarellii]QXC28634.1 zinc ribbon-containing protein [Aeromonas sp. FDAARGOS 1409]QXW30627.1 zinc ribbon-containing protein [Aeromonas sanarellii]WOX49355.1 zinc ribbon-containing protein [Aeromonas sp. XH]
MDKRQKGYEAFIAQLRKQWEETEEFQGERLNRMIARVQAYMEAAGDLTKDELALIAEYVKRDLGNYDEGKQEVPESAFMLALKDTAWSWLADVTDRAQVEWQELADELEHKGIYRAGDWVGLGVLVCDHCEWRHTVLHPEQLGTCPECGADEYHREPLSP